MLDQVKLGKIRLGQVIIFFIDLILSVEEPEDSPDDWDSQDSGVRPGGDIGLVAQQGKVALAWVRSAEQIVDFFWSFQK